MKNVTLSIPDGEFDFFMKLIEKFNYANSEQIILSEKQKLVLDERRNMNHADNYLTLQEAKDKLKQKYGI